MKTSFSTATNIGGEQGIGAFQLEVLKTICILNPESAYGTKITSYLSSVHKKTIALPQLYTALKTLEDKDYLTSKVQQKQKKQRGRPKRLYTLTNKSIELLKNPSYWHKSPKP